MWVKIRERRQRAPLRQAQVVYQDLDTRALEVVAKGLTATAKGAGEEALGDGVEVDGEHGTAPVGQPLVVGVELPEIAPPGAAVGG
jgi:hypothetical protein